MKNGYVIGLDGGGTKTTACLADLRGNILRKVRSGPSNPLKIGLEKSLLSLKKTISEVSRGRKKKEISSAYLGLAGGLERDKGLRRRIRLYLAKRFPFPIFVGGDQKIAFRAGTREKDGLLIIAGTGSISMGWRGGKEAASGGRDWLLGDEGSAFWIGRTALSQAIKIFDGRQQLKSILKDLIFREFKIRGERDIYKKFYRPDFVERVASVSAVVDLAARRGDRLSRDILRAGAGELAQAALSVIRRLGFKKRDRFPLVLSGSVFRSRFILEGVKKDIKKRAPKARFILSRNEPVVGAVRLAIENLK